jgi:hypothetical protein
MNGPCHECAGRRSEPIPARSVFGLKARGRAGNETKPPRHAGRRSAQITPRHGTENLCGPSARNLILLPGNPARSRVPLARTPCPDRAGIGSDLRPDECGLSTTIARIPRLRRPLPPPAPQSRNRPKRPRPRHPRTSRPTRYTRHGERGGGKIFLEIKW